MINWAGMVIEPGVVVWRGARAGNTSDYKIGKVESVNPAKGTARVEWLYECGYRSWMVERYLPTDRYEHLPNIVRMRASKGSPSVESLAVIDVDLVTLDNFCREWSRLSEEAQALKDSGAEPLDKRR